MRVHYFQHVACEDLGTIAAWAEARGHTLTSTRFFAGSVPPDVASFDWLIVMGGPMNVYEEDAYPWLRAEKQCIAAAIQADKVVLGICLGAQLIADVLGARVTRNAHREIGWWPVSLTEAGRQAPLFSFLPRQFTAYHWHGDTFALPPGAVHSASSEGCRHQAFTYRDRVVGLQFHLEMTPDNVRSLLAVGAAELTEDRYVQTADEMLADLPNCTIATTVMHGILDRLHEVTARSDESLN